MTYIFVLCEMLFRLKLYFILFLAMPVMCFLYSRMCPRCMYVFEHYNYHDFLSTIYGDGH